MQAWISYSQRSQSSDVCADGGHAFVGIGVGPPRETELSVWVGISQAKMNAESFGSHERKVSAQVEVVVPIEVQRLRYPTGGTPLTNER